MCCKGVLAHFVTPTRYKLVRKSQSALGRNRSGSECQAQACGDEQLGYGRADKEISPREDRCADAIKKEQSEDWPNQNEIRLDKRRQLPKQNGLDEKTDS